MPELPEVETVRRMLQTHVVGRTVRAVRLSGLKLREPVSPSLARSLKGRAIRGVSRLGKFLIFELEGGVSLLSHLGMSGRWLFSEGERDEPLPHVHARIAFADGSRLRFQDPRRFGLCGWCAPSGSRATARSPRSGPTRSQAPQPARRSQHEPKTSSSA